MGGANVSTQAARWLALTALGLLAGCAAMASGPAAEMRSLQARAAYERGVGHLRERQTALAVAALQEAIALDGEVAVYWNTLGSVYLDLGRVQEALTRFQRAVEIDPTYAEAHLNTGVALAEGRQWEEATAAYRRALALPTLSTPHVGYQNLGLALYHLKRYREAEDALRFAISLDPQLGLAYYNLGLVFTADGRPEEAKAAFRRARDLAPQTPLGQAAVERLKDLGEGG
jgi:Tfp pilus assembly protein PilF